jgi:hypothetical protein
MEANFFAKQNLTDTRLEQNRLILLAILFQITNTEDSHMSYVRSRLEAAGATKEEFAQVSGWSKDE